MISKMTPTKDQIINRERWVAALRSGAYRQGRNHLRSGLPDDSCFCVWGVACDVADPRLWTPAGESGWFYATNKYSPSDAIEKLYGIREGDGLLQASIGDDLMYGNDTRWMSFDELADCIELFTLVQLDEASGATHG